MPNFIWTAKDKAGKSVVREIAAGSASEAEAALLAEGCEDLKLIRDEIGSVASEGIQRTFAVGGNIVAITPEKIAKIHGEPSATFFRAFRKGVIANAGTILVLAGVATIEFSLGNEWIGFLFLILIPALPAYSIWCFLPSILLAKLHKAADWHRWNKVLRLVRILEAIRNFRSASRPALPASHLARERAKALAGLGRLSEA